MHGFNDNPTGVDTCEQTLKTQLVWDLPLRLFHWSMVCVVTLAAVTGYLAPEWWLDFHVYAGYTLGVLLTFRLFWGIIGSYYSRFGAFPLKLKEASKHLLSILKFNSNSYAGHNPIGAWMIVILLTTLILLVVTGLLFLGGQENQGPLASFVTFSIVDVTAEIHETLAGILIGAVVIHLLGVFAEVKIFRHPVLKAMISGRKPVGADYVKSGGSGILRGVALFSLVVGTVLFMGMKLNALPTDRWRNIDVPPVYKSECGDCHHPYHPSLRTAAEWQIIMADLEDHFGEDASLDEETNLLIKNFLTENDARSFDTEISNNIGRVETASHQITETPYWKKRHHDVQSSLFKHSSVGSKANCNGCHKDAETGRYADENIHLPNGDQK